MPGWKAAPVAGAVALIGGVGCSLLVQGPPTTTASTRDLDCTSSYLAPALDAGLAAYVALAAVAVAYSPNQTDGKAIATMMLAGAAGASSTYGYWQVSRCREAKTALAERLLATGALLPPVATAPVGMPARDPWLAEGPPPGDDHGPAPAPAPGAGRADAGVGR